MTNQNKETIFTELIERTLAKMPSDFAKWVKKKIVFVFPKEKELARTIPKKESKHYEAVIILHDELLSQEEGYQEHSLLHEIAHVRLKHTKQNDAEKERKQENEAHALALKWLTDAKFEEARKKMTLDRNLKSAQQQKTN
jgi:Zn-dependent peptidase ImmA (M78 family)